MSQRDLTDCATFTNQAWQARLEAVKSRLFKAKTIDPRFGSAEQRVQRLVESQDRWKTWTKGDCDPQAEGSKGGSMHGMEVQLCLSRHAAQRGIELEALTFWWGKSFNLPE